MKDLSTTLKPEDFLAHADFVHRLARSLIADTSRADDVVQETWIAALRRPPDETGSVRAWLARVVRNLVATAYRAEGRRAKREKRAALREAVPSTEEIFQREAIRRRVVEAVVALDEPYRSAVVLRYYEDLPPREIALRLDLPVATVRTHIRRGLEKLRQEFDADHGGDRRSWCVALAPIAGLELLSSAAGGATSAAAAMTGAVAMSAKVKIAAIVILVLSLGVALWQILPDSLFLDGEMEPAVAEGRARLLVGERLKVDGQNDALVGLADPDGEDGSGRETIAPDGFFIKGRVIDSKSGAPVTSFDFRLVSADMGPDVFFYLASATVQETVHDAEGRFHFALPRGGKYRLEVHSSRYQTARLDKVEITAGDDAADLHVELDPGMVLSGRVVADDTDLPVPDTVVTMTKDAGIDLRWLLAGRPERCVHAVTDEESRFRLTGIAAKSDEVVAVHPDYCGRTVEIDHNELSGIEIRLCRSDLSIHGVALDAQGAPKAGVLVMMGREDTHVIRFTVTDSGGRYRLPPLSPGRVELMAGPPPGETESSFGFLREWKRVEVKDKDVEVRFGPRPWHITWQGTVFGFDDLPEPWALVGLESRSADLAELEIASDRYYGVCDHEGRFLIGKIKPGRYVISVGIPDGAYAGEIDTLNLVMPGTTTRDIRVIPPGKSGKLGAISGRLFDEATGAPLGKSLGVSVSAQKKFQTDKAYHATIDEAGGFRLQNLPAGIYIVRVFVTGYPRKQLPDMVLAEAQVVDSLDIAMRRGGRLRIEVRGLSEEDLNHFQYELQRGDGPRDWHVGRPGEDGIFETVSDLAPGVWTAFLRFHELGIVERQCEVFEGQLSEIVVDKSDLHFSSIEVAVEGVLLKADRSPLSGARLTFQGQGIPGRVGLSNGGSALTGSGGGFTIDGLGPGRWKVFAEMENRSLLINFSDLVIPPNPDDPHLIRLIVPGGSVTGRLCNGTDDLPFDDDGPEWWASIVDSRSGRTVSEHCGWLQGRRGSFFSLSGVPDGEFYLKVYAKGYSQFQTAPFTFSGVGDKDLGLIRLTPSGRLLIIVEDRAGNRIETFQAFCNGKPLLGHPCSPLAPGRKRWEGLPLGQIEIEVDAKGFESAVKTVILEQDRVGEVRFVLGRK